MKEFHHAESSTTVGSRRPVRDLFLDENAQLGLRFLVTGQSGVGKSHTYTLLRREEWDYSEERRVFDLDTLASRKDGKWLIDWDLVTAVTSFLSTKTVVLVGVGDNMSDCPRGVFTTILIDVPAKQLAEQRRMRGDTEDKIAMATETDREKFLQRLEALNLPIDHVVSSSDDAVRKILELIDAKE